MADRAGRDIQGPGGPGGAQQPGPGGPGQLSKRDNYNSADRRGQGPPQTNGVGPGGGPGGRGGPGDRGLSNGGPEGPGYGRSARVSRRDLGAGGQQLDPGQGGQGGLAPGDRGRSAPAANSRGSPGGRRPGGRGGNSRSYNTSPSGGGYLPPEAGLHGGHPGDHGDFDTGRMERGMDRGMDRPMDRGMDRSGGPHARSRSASRGFPTRTAGGGPGYHSLDRDRDGYGGDRDFMPIDRPRDRSLDRPMDRAGGPGAMGDYGPPYSSGFGGRRDRSLDRSRVDPMSDLDDGTGYRDRDPHRTRLSPNPISLQRDAYMQELQSTNSDLQRDLANLKKELELTNQKLGSSMHSIKTFWSPELKKERALRKEESAKYALMNDQLKLLNSENQVREVLKSNLIDLFKRILALIRTKL